MKKNRKIVKKKISVLEESDTNESDTTENDQTNTYTRTKPSDMIAQNDIRKRLINYDIVEDIATLLPGQQIVYFEKLPNGCFRYKPGGFVAVNRSPEYIVLTNGRRNWSVQLANHIILVHYDKDRLISSYQHMIAQCEKKIDQYRHLIKTRDSTIKRLTEENNKLDR